MLIQLIKMSLDGNKYQGLATENGYHELKEFSNGDVKDVEVAIPKHKDVDSEDSEEE